MVTLVAMFMVVGCAGEEVPSCQQAVEHYYSAGCWLYNPSTGARYTTGEMIGSCKALLASAPHSCEDDVENLLICFDSEPSGCDCSVEQDALYTCD